MSSEPSSAELFTLLQESKSTLYGQGASWNGEVVAISGLFIFAAGMLTFIVLAIIKANRTCESEGGQTVTTQVNCGYRTVCVDPGVNYCHAYHEQYACDEKSECVR